MPTGALRALIEILNIPREDIKVAATVALASMKERAVDAVPALKQLAMSEDENAANAAVCALGEIPGEHSVQAIMETLERCKDRPASDKAWVIVETCARRASDFCHLLPQLEPALKMIYSGDPAMYKGALDKIRWEARRDPLLSLESIKLPGQVDIQAAHSRYSAGRFEDALPQRDLASGIGVILDDRFCFKTNVAGEVGLKIHRHPRDPNRYLIILSNDAESYGASLTHYVEHIAWAVREIYSLQNADITWVEHNAPASGFAVTEEDDFHRVTFAREDYETRFLKEPEWRYIRNFRRFLKEWQG